MTITDQYARLAPSTIVVPPERQRTSLDLDEGFLASLRDQGIISPLLVREDLVLVAGGRRLAGALALGMLGVPVRFVSRDADQITIEIIELTENRERLDLPWQDEVRAVARLHTLWKTRDPEWTQEASRAALGGAQMHLYLRVARALGDAEESKKIASATGMRAAFNICSRIDERQHDAVLEEINSVADEMFEGVTGDATSPAADSSTLGAPPSPREGEGEVFVPGASSSPTISLRSRVGRARGSDASPDVLCDDFLEWARTYAGPRFNFVHCDFPYGKRVFAGEWGGRDAEEEFKYQDEPDTYWALCAGLAENLDRLMTPTAHLMFWCSSEIKNLYDTIEFFRERAPGLIFQPRALTWHKSDNVGIVPDPLRGPRWICETALMATRGDRPLVKPLASSYSAPTARSLHPSTKPEPVLRHFFGMFVDSTTRLLDPTCGSGSALRAAESLGASSVLGIERSGEFAASATKALREFRNLKELTR